MALGPELTPPARSAEPVKMPPPRSRPRGASVENGAVEDAEIVPDAPFAEAEPAPPAGTLVPFPGQDEDEDEPELAIGPGFERAMEGAPQVGDAPLPADMGDAGVEEDGGIEGDDLTAGAAEAVEPRQPDLIERAEAEAAPAHPQPEAAAPSAQPPEARFAARRPQPEAAAAPSQDHEAPSAASAQPPEDPAAAVPPRAAAAAPLPGDAVVARSRPAPPPVPRSGILGVLVRADRAELGRRRARIVGPAGRLAAIAERLARERR